MPITSWKKGESKMRMALQVYTPLDGQDTGLADNFQVSPTFMWFSDGEFVTTAKGHHMGTQFQLDSGCRRSLAAGKFDLIT
jgi:hypothetical protein